MLKRSKHQNDKTVKPQHFIDGQNEKRFNGQIARKLNLVKTKILKLSKRKKNFNQLQVD